MKRIIGLLSAIGLLTFTSATWAVALPAPVRYEANGHYYQLVNTSSMNFEAAKAYANTQSYLGAQGHLVSITSAGEQAFVAALGVPEGTWIGGFQADTSNEPAGGWTWIDGEPWAYTNWGANEPNEGAGGNENCLHWRSDNAWNDVSCTASYSSMVIEYDSKDFESEPEPVPTLSGWLLAMLSLLLMTAGYAWLRHKRS